jgi:hypothetical protein
MQKRSFQIGIFFLIGLAIAGIIFLQYRTKIQEKVPAPVGASPATAVTTRTAGIPRSTGCGWSVADDPRQGVRQAVLAARAGIGSSTPVYAFVTTTSGYDHSVVLDELKKDLPPQVKIHGATSAFGVMTNEGLHKGKVGAVALLLIASTDVTFGVSSVNLADFSDPEKAGKEAILQAYRDAGVPQTLRPRVILMTGTKARPDQMKVLNGIAQVVGTNTPVIGGDAADDQNKEGWRQFTRQTLHQNGLGVVLTAIFTETKVGWSFEHGFRITDKEGTVTRADGKVIQEINHRPALDVYNEWLNGKLYEAIKTKDFYGIVQFTGQNPLCKVLKGKEGQIGYITAHPLPSKENLVNKYLPVAAAIETGSTVRLFAGTWQTILNRAEYLPAKALIQGEMASRESAWGVVFFCRGASKVIPASELPKVPLLINNSIEEVPFVGLITGGEQGPIPGIRNVHANLAECMVIVGK